MTNYFFEPIGFIHSCFKEKFGIPRQPGLVPSATATLQIESSYCRAEAFRHLETFSHIWIIFVFHKSVRHQWRATVRPPRLGGNRRVGVFASRSGFRPNPIGQSAVELISINRGKGKIELNLGGVDLLDGTPVLDVKPYLPYADAIYNAKAGYAHQQPVAKWPVIFSEEAAQACTDREKSRYPGLKKAITDLLGLDPRPGYRENRASQGHGMRLWDLNIKFRFNADHIMVEAIEPLS
ncbi:MAG: tRNA (N6-threonylcarbamoyladenosine(37)-N6)-methyltransferase TrmO [Desulfobacteraceae bacterium]